MPDASIGCRLVPTVFAAAGAAQSIPDTYPAIAVALNLLDDFESHYRGSGRTLGWTVSRAGVSARIDRNPEPAGHDRIREAQRMSL